MSFKKIEGTNSNNNFWLLLSDLLILFQLQDHNLLNYSSGHQIGYVVFMACEFGFDFEEANSTVQAVAKWPNEF
jgi:hypothetical protein